MWKKVITHTLFFALTAMLAGCGSAGSMDHMDTEQAEITADTKPSEEKTGDMEIYEDETSDSLTQTIVQQGGPFGRISVTLPAGWAYEACPVDSDSLMAGMYGIQFRPEGVSEGYVELCYMESFGVCGMGLEEEKVTLAGENAIVGTFDNHNYWDFVSFQDDYKGIVALTYDAGKWWEEYGEQIFDIMNTLHFDRDIREGAAAIDDPASGIEEIGLNLTISNITVTGARLSFYQSGGHPTGQLEFGEEFIIEKSENGEWKEAPVAVTGHFGFHDVAYTVQNEDVTEYKQDWETLYGKLSPGEYRIGKTVLDFRDTGDYDSYMIYAHFILYD